jgi:hypothetical protein
MRITRAYTNKNKPQQIEAITNYEKLITEQANKKEEKKKGKKANA